MQESITEIISIFLTNFKNYLTQAMSMHASMLDLLFPFSQTRGKIEGNYFSRLRIFTYSQVTNMTLLSK